MKTPKYVVFLSPQAHRFERPYEFDDESAARSFRMMWGGRMFKNIDGNYIKVK